MVIFPTVKALSDKTIKVFMSFALNSLCMKFEVMWNNEHRVISLSWVNFLLCYSRLVDILLPTIMAAAI